MIASIGHIPAIAATQYGDKLALVCPERSLSFTELDQLSNQCANALVTLGVGSGDRDHALLRELLGMGGELLRGAQNRGGYQPHQCHAHAHRGGVCCQ